MRKGTVPQVVAEPCKSHSLDVPSLDVDLSTLEPPDSVGVLSGQVRDAQRMLKPVVAGTRKHKVRGPQLLEVPEALERRRIYDGDLERGEVEVAVDGVVEDLMMVGVFGLVSGERRGLEN